MYITLFDVVKKLTPTQISVAASGARAEFRPAPGRAPPIRSLPSEPYSTPSFKIYWVY